MNKAQQTALTVLEESGTLETELLNGLKHAAQNPLLTSPRALTLQLSRPTPTTSVFFSRASSCESRAIIPMFFADVSNLILRADNGHQDSLASVT